METLKKVLKKATSKKNAKTDVKNASNIKKAISAVKDLMYIYPKGCTTLDARKKFRTDARRHRDSYIKNIKKAAPGAEREALRAEASSFAKKTFVSPPKF